MPGLWTAPVSLTTANASGVFGLAPSGAPRALNASLANPLDVRLTHVELDLTAIVTGTSVTWSLARDSAGDQRVTDEVTDTIVAGATAGAGSVRRRVDELITMTGELWVIAKLNAGTATAVAKLTYTAPIGPAPAL
jgi:hypothetical protein